MTSIRSQIKQGLAVTKGHRGKLAAAAFFDLLSAIPWIGLIFTGIGYGSLWLWMRLDKDDLDPSLFSGNTKKLASTAAEFIGGALGLGIIPGITMWAFFVIAEAKAEQSGQEVIDISTPEENTQDSKNIAGRIESGERQRKTSAYMDEGDWSGEGAA